MERIGVNNKVGGMMALKLNHFCLVTGIVLIILALSVFAQAQTFVIQKTWGNDFTRFIDLTDYVSDGINFSVLSQSNTGLLSCFIDSNSYLSCSKGTMAESNTIILVRGLSVSSTNTDFNLNVVMSNVAPFWTQIIPTQCINQSQSSLLDLTNYAYDVEDGNTNIVFSLVNQSNTSGINCSISNQRYLSCDLSTNTNQTNDLNIKVLDSMGKYAYALATIRSNCYDINGDPIGETRGKGTIYFSSESKNICLEQCVSNATQLTLKNNTLERKCFNFATEVLPYEDLSGVISPNSVCLAAGESTNLTLNTSGCNVEQRPYTIRVFETDSNIEMFFNYSVGTCNNTQGFSIREFDGTICQGEQKSITVSVRNTSSNKQRINLLADNVMLLPYFSQDFIDLSPSQQKNIQLNINARSSDIGEYRVELIGSSPNYQISKSLRVSVVDCSQTPKRTFALSVPNICFDVAKGASVSSQFTITSQVPQTSGALVHEKQFYLNMYGLPSEIGYSSVLLTSGQSKVIPFTITVPVNAQAGHKLVTISASDGTEWNAFTDNKNICINVLGENRASLNVITQSRDIEWGSSGIFEVQLINNGDFDANFDLFTIESPRGVSVDYSDSRISVPKGQSRIIYVSISSGALSEVRDNQQVKIYARGSTNLSAIIYFNIKGKTILDDLEILSANSQIRMNAHTTKEFDLIIRNSNNTTVKNIVVSIENLPRDVNSDIIIIDELQPNRIISVSGKITAGDVNGVFNPAFVVSNNSVINKKQFELIIQGSQGNAFFSGLFALGNISGGELVGVIFWSLVWAIVLIILVSVIVYAVRVITRPRKGEVWVK